MAFDGQLFKGFHSKWGSRYNTQKKWVPKGSFNLNKEVNTSWSDDEYDFSNGKGTGVFHPYTSLTNNSNEETNRISFNDVLPDDLQERILSSLPVACMLKACCVCKKWNEIVHSTKFALNNTNVSPKKPWYLMLTSSDEPMCCIYDCVLRQWYNFQLPLIVNHTWIIATSRGFVCFMDEDNSSQLYVCNPITRQYKKLNQPFGPYFSIYTTLAFSVDPSTLNHNIAVVRSTKASDDYLQWDISVSVYFSETTTWLHPVFETFIGWRAGNVSAICNDNLYVLVFSTRPGETQSWHGLLTYNLYNPSFNGSLIDSFISVPCWLTCGRLMDLDGRLVMVGGIGRHNRPGVIRGIGIWVLKGRDWEEVSRMPRKFFFEFREFDDVFASSGGGDLVYIQSYGGTALLMFDMNTKEWGWSHKCPITKKFPLQLFSGFCFEPQLEVLA